MLSFAGLLSRAVGLAMAGLAGWIGWTCLTRELDGRPVRELAARIERQGAPAADYWRGKPDLLTFDARLTCHNRIGRAQLTVALAAMDAALKGEDLDRHDTIRDMASDLARSNIRCTPLDGNLWLRLGMLQLGASGLNDDVRTIFGLSERFAPAEGWVLESRIPLYADLAAKGVPDFADRAARDFERFVVLDGAPARILDIYGQAPTVLRAALDRGLAATSPRRRVLIGAAADKAGVDIGQPKRVIPPLFPPAPPLP